MWKGYLKIQSEELKKEQWKKRKMREGTPGKAPVGICNANRGHLDGDAGPPHLMKRS